MLTQSFRGEFQLRVGNWKLLNHVGSGGNDYSRGELRNYALTEQNPNLRGQLYNLEEDPGETMNLYEIERERRESMERLLGELTAPVASAKGQDAGEPNTKVGRTAPLGRKPMK